MKEMFRKESRKALAQIATLPPVVPPADPLKAHSDRLPEIPRLAYRLHDVEGLGVDEIAGVTGIRPARVRRALERARGLLAVHAKR